MTTEVTARDSGGVFARAADPINGPLALAAAAVHKAFEDTPTLVVTVPQHDDNAFEDIEIGSSEPVPLNEILERIANADASGDNSHEDGGDDHGESNLIRLHAAATPISSEISSSSTTASVSISALTVSDTGNTPTISATVNVATLDLSDPESVQRHLSHITDTILKVSTCLSISPFAPCLSSTVSPSTSPSPSSSSSLSLLSPSAAISSLLPSSPCPPPAPVPPKPKTSSSSSSPSAGASSSSARPSSTQRCATCSKAFSNASALAKHRLTHSEERRYHCSICDKAFKRQDHLNGHLLTHRSTKPFACLAEGCGKSYCDARSLRRHKENHHAAKDAVGDKASDKDCATDCKENLAGVSSLLMNHLQHLPAAAKEVRKPAAVATATVAAAPSKEPKIATKTVRAISGNNNISSVSVESTLSSGDAKTDAGQPRLQEPGVDSSDAKACEPPSDKSVECTMCNRKFKNIPALNGHMRLHGGYYKKDQPQPPLADIAIARANGLLLEDGTRKRKALADGAAANAPEKTSKLSADALRVLQQHVVEPPTSASDTPSLAFHNLPPPDTRQLLANLELRTLRLVQQHSESIECKAATAFLLPDHPALMTTSNPTNALPCSAFPSCPLPLSASSPRSFTAGQSGSWMSPAQPLIKTGQTTSCITAHVPSYKLMNVMKARGEADVEPRVGHDYQADVPDEVLKPFDQGGDLDEDTSELVWSPKLLSRVPSAKLHSLLLLSSSCLMPGGSAGEERALQLLVKHSGNFLPALKDLVAADGEWEQREWSDADVSAFYDSYVRNHKDFSKISNDIPGKSVKDCVDFYYTWKNACQEESQSFKAIFSMAAEASPESSVAVDGTDDDVDAVSAVSTACVGASDPNPSDP